MPETPASTSSGSASVNRWDRARWAAAALLLIAVTIAVTYSYLTPHLRSCDDLVARVGQSATATSCEPLGITDAPVVLVLVLALGLVAPDMKRISIGGVIELERNIKEQEQRTETLERQIAIMASATASAEMHVHYSDTWPSSAKVRKPSEAEFAEKARQIWPAGDDTEGDNHE